MLKLDAPDLTRKQAKVACAIALLTAERSMCPSVRDIMKFLDYRNPNGIIGHIRALERKGWVGKQEFRARTIRLLKPLRFLEFPDK